VARRDTWDPARTDLELQSDLTPADWLEPLLKPGSFEVAMSVPSGYEVYARIFFPFSLHVVGPDGQHSREDLTWTEVTRRNGRVAHPLMERETIVRDVDGHIEEVSPTSHLSVDQLTALLPILRHHTTSSEGWFLLWDGFGDLNRRALNPQVPQLHHPMRDLFLLRGSIDAYDQLPNDPNYWWPDDRSWLLASDTDFQWNYLACSRNCLMEVLDVPVIDAIETRLDNPAHSGMDTVNDPEGIVPRHP
jgi:hypothetical protein